MSKKFANSEAAVVIQPTPTKAIKPGRKSTSSEQILGTNDARGRAYRFYQSCRWDLWHEEFCQSRMPNGGLRYPTVYSFAKAKAKNEDERRWIQEAISPEPELKEGQKRGAMPWLGDWLKQRRAGLLIPHDRAESLERVLKERVNGLELTRIVSGFSVEWMRMVDRVRAQLDDFYGDQVFQPHLSMKENERRVAAYVKILMQTQEMSSTACRDFLACHGIHRDNITILARLEATRVLAESTPADSELHKIQLKPGVTADLINGLSLDDILMMSAIKEKIRHFDIVIPDFEITREQKPACDEFVKIFPVEQFAELKLLLVECFQEPDPAYTLETLIQQFTKKRNSDTIARVWTQIEKFNSLLSGHVLSTFRTIFIERFRIPAPRDAGTWTNFCIGFRQFARQYHGDALRANPETKKLLDKYVGFFLEPVSADSK